jgi:hypothetical protein
MTSQTADGPLRERLDALIDEHRGPLPLHWVLLHVLRELAQHCGHIDILREQILADDA